MWGEVGGTDSQNEVKGRVRGKAMGKLNSQTKKGKTGAELNNVGIIFNESELVVQSCRT